MSKELDRLLYRAVKAAGAFEGKFPPSNRTVEYLGTGMTDFSMKSMAELVLRYYQQAANVAPMLEGETLQDTCEEIHYFLYNWFQYHSDDQDQYLRSPAASWAQRYEGIDCKSYSILASCILSCLGIVHYLRRIKQPAAAPDQWTHVYVIVPANQENAALNKGYYVIDGTVPTTKECEYIEKDDLYMSMQHYALNAPAPQPLNAGIDISKIKSDIFPRGISLSSLSCIGGSMDSKDLEAAIQVVNPWMTSQYEAINNAISSNSSSVMSSINTLIAATYGVYDHAEYTASHRWSSACSRDAANGYKALCQYYVNILQQAFFPWIQEFFDVSYTSITKLNASCFPFDTQPNGGKGFKKSNFNRNVTFNQLNSLKLKAATTSITRFVLNNYVSDSNNYTNGAFNADQMLDGFTDILVRYTQPSAGNSGSSSNTSTGTATTTTTTTQTGNTSTSNGGTTNVDDEDPTTEDKPTGSNTVYWILGGAAALAVSAKLLFFSGAAGLGKPAKTSKKSK